MNTKFEKYVQITTSIAEKLPRGSIGSFWKEQWQTLTGSYMPWHSGPQTSDLVESFIRDLSIEDKNSVLEVGCGDCPRYAKIAVERGLEAWATDVSSSAIDQAKEHYAELADKITWLAGDILTLDTDGHTFNLIVDDGCFHLFNCNDDRMKFAEKIKSLLADNGIWISLISSSEDVDEKNKNLLGRSLGEIVAVIEPFLKIIKIDTMWKTCSFNFPNRRFWIVVAQQRHVPAQHWHKND